MLFSYFFTNEFFIFLQSGCYVDFFLKKISEILVRNVLIYTSLYFGEKYFIEIFTKKIIENSIVNLNKVSGLTTLDFNTFFYQLIMTIIYIIILCNCFYLIF